MLACQYEHKYIVQLLLDNSERIELNARDDNGETAFMRAAEENRKDIVKLLLDHSGSNIDLNARANNGRTAITIVCQYEHKDIVKLILNHLDQNGWTLFYTNVAEHDMFWDFVNSHFQF